MDKITLNAHAKINLSLEITSKRADGYHEIVSFMQGTGLHDVVSIEKCTQKATKYNLPHCTINGIVVYLCTDAKTIPTDMSNLAFRAVKAFMDASPADGGECPETATALMLDIRKKLPVAAGIAGGSGNAAAVLLGLNELSGRPFTLRQLMAIGAGIGADVPFSVFMNAHRNRGVLDGLSGLDEACDSAWTAGIGDIVRPARSVPRHVVLANPGTAVSTRAAYEAMDAIGYTDARCAGQRLFVNDMEKFTLGADPKAAALMEFMRERLDADDLLMSGSGPTMAAYYTDANKAAAGMEAMAELAAKDGSVRAWLTDSGM